MAELSLRGILRRGLRAHRLQFSLQSVQPFPVRFNRFDQAIESGMEIVIPRIGKRYRELGRRMTNEINVFLVVEHLY